MLLLYVSTYMENPFQITPSQTQSSGTIYTLVLFFTFNYPEKIKNKKELEVEKFNLLEDITS